MVVIIIIIIIIIVLMLLNLLDEFQDIGNNNLELGPISELLLLPLEKDHDTTM